MSGGIIRVLFLVVFSMVALISNARAQTTVTVTSNPLWKDTGIVLSSGDSVTITASGSWSWNGSEFVGPQGGPNQFLHYDEFEHFDDNDHGRLLGFVGTDPCQGHCGDGTTFFPQPSGYISVGAGTTLTAPTGGGKLWLGFNDDARSGATYDNVGSVTAVISVGVTDRPVFTGPSNEPSLAVDPIHPGHVVVGFNDLTNLRNVGCKWSESYDGGLTWSSRPGEVLLPNDETGQFKGQGDPWLRYAPAPDGRLFYSCMSQTDGISVSKSKYRKRKGVFIAVSISGRAADFQPATAIVKLDEECSLKGSIFKTCDENTAEHELADHPSIDILQVPGGLPKLVICWVHYSQNGNTSKNSSLMVATSPLNVVDMPWPSTPIAKGAAACAVGGGASGSVGLAWWNTGTKPQLLQLSKSTDGSIWNTPVTLATLDSLIDVGDGDNAYSTMPNVLSPPFGLVVPSPGGGLRAIFQSRNPTSRIFLADERNGWQALFVRDPARDQSGIKFLPGTSCSTLVGGYEITDSVGHFRYKVWQADAAGNAIEIFKSRDDLDVSTLDPTDPRFNDLQRFLVPRIGEYTSVDCSPSGDAWAAWTYVRGGESIWAARIQ